MLSHSELNNLLANAHKPDADLAHDDVVHLIASADHPGHAKQAAISELKFPVIGAALGTLTGAAIGKTTVGFGLGLGTSMILRGVMQFRRVSAFNKAISEEQNVPDKVDGNGIRLDGSLAKQQALGVLSDHRNMYLGMSALGGIAVIFGISRAMK